VRETSDRRGFSELMERGTKGIECDLIRRARGARARTCGLTLHIYAARDHERSIKASPRQSHHRELGSRSSFPHVGVAAFAHSAHSISGGAEVLPPQRGHLLGTQELTR
jgi:hypothetical protein